MGGLFVGAALIYHGLVHNPIFYLLLFFGGFSVVSRLFGWDGVSPTYYKTTPVNQLRFLGVYVALIAALLIGMYENNKYRMTPSKLKRRQEQEQQTGMMVQEQWYQDGSQTDGVYDDYFENNSFFGGYDKKPRDRGKGQFD